MWIEREHDGLEPARTSDVGSFGEHGAMSTMDSVEVANRDEAARFFSCVQETIHSAYLINTAAERKAQGFRTALRID